MRGAEIRDAFLRYFAERGHQIVPSAPLTPDRDPTLMFVNAGMVPFKRVFLGEESRPYTRAASSQKSMRVSGKHNDLEEVGRTPRHQTFFEMLGNFSFGDYFKSDAIGYAWDLLTNVLRLDPERLVVSVFESDDEAYALWRDQVGLPEDRIYRLGESENFWAMGDTGPCGPCSEIHVIRKPACARPDCNPACSCGRFLEIWNLVFMQYEQTPDGRRLELPKPSIDTGMGLERIASVLQGVETNYDTDLFLPIIQRTSEISGRGYHTGVESDVSLRVVADHVRACSFLIGDGVLPSNEGRGYVLRRVLRRAARHGVLLGVEEPFLYDVAATVVELMGRAFPELVERRPFIQETIRREEERFLRTLGRGLSLLDEEIARARRERRRSLTGDVVFKLYDTFGFPTDLTEDILRTHELQYDRDGFDACMREQAERARAAWQGSGQGAPREVYFAIAKRGSSRFVGYESLEARSPVLALLRDGQEVQRASEGERVEIAVEVTPFYAESGGQVGDVGAIEGPSGRIEVEDTVRPVEGLVVHSGRVVLGEIHSTDTVTLRVDAAKRAATVRNHSATHLFHGALRALLGPQVQQAGSLVAPDRLRFDFTHDAPLSAQQVRELEDRVNAEILANHPGSVAEKSYPEAIESGAIAIFEEKYGERVRVVSFGESVELCGGTHARATGDIGSFRITGQFAVGAGVRRVEAQTGTGALEYARRESQTLQQAAQLLRSSSAELPERIGRLIEREKQLEKELEKTRAELRRGGSAADPLGQVREIAGIRVLATELADASPKDLRGIVDELKQRLGSGIVLLASRQEGKAALAMGVTKDLTDRFKAGELIAAVVEPVGGRGGGRPDFAQAGGPNTDGIPRALELLAELIARS